MVVADGAEATTLTVSLASKSVVANVEDEPLKVWVAVQVFAALKLTPAAIVAHVPSPLN